jgi:3-hydroxyisobutyrate dehydrogenase-like beta-hydroxyacid dehydrogenase
VSGPAFCVFGLGEAGSLLAGDLAAAGVEVHGYDPAEVATPEGVVRHHEPRAAVARAGVVLGVTAAADATTALTQALDAIPPGAVYADLATAPPALKRRLGAIARDAALGFADVALMSVVAGSGLRTPALASGPAASDFVATLVPLGMPVQHAGDEPGEAATRKLLRSVVMKGLAAVVVESMRAAEAAGLAGETWANVVGQITAADEALLRRLVTGTGRHAARRVHEMEATAALLSELGVEPTMTDATTTHLRRIADDPSLVPELPAWWSGPTGLTGRGRRPPTGAEPR